MPGRKSMKLTPLKAVTIQYVMFTVTQ
jgi:hypothetical protein